ncbi:MAG: winged helix-turn-helix domain-containing protein [Pyrinomonadaceae bacterium]
MKDKIFQFEDFCLDPKQRKFLYQNKTIHLSSRAFKILLLLVQKHGEVVEKEELLEKVWSDSYVEEGNLAVHIHALRRVLGEKRGEKKFIETVSGRGYSFIFPVKRVEPVEPNEQLPALSESVQSTADKNLLQTSASLAVLPFASENKDADFERLAGGITQSLIDNLSRIPRLKVMAYSAVKNYEDSTLDLPEIGFLLGVDKLLLGRLSEYKDNLEIDVELVSAVDKRYIWGTQYNCKLADIPEVRKKLSLAIAEKLELQLSSIDDLNLTSRRQTSDAEAYKLYLKGKYILDHYQASKDYQDSLRSALSFFQQALKKDPNYALAYVGSGRVYFLLFNDTFMSRAEVYDKCQTAVELAFNADSNLSEAFVLRGAIQMNFDRNWLEAEKSFKQAIALTPNNAYAYHNQSFLLACLGKFDEAIFYQNQALQLDPTSLILNSGLVNRFFLAKNFRKAIVQAEEALELDPRSVSPLSIMGLCFAQLGLFDEAFKNLNKAIDIQPLEELILDKAYVHALAGETAEAKKILNSLLAEMNYKQCDFADVAAVYSALRENDKTFEYLEKAFIEGSSNLLFLKADPRFLRSHEDSRFNVILRKLNFI